MLYRTRRKYTDEMKSYMWDRYQKGDSVWAIDRSFDRLFSSSHGQNERPRKTLEYKTPASRFNACDASIG
jgi:hypothetical protein